MKFFKEWYFPALVALFLIAVAIVILIQCL